MSNPDTDPSSQSPNDLSVRYHRNKKPLPRASASGPPFGKIALDSLTLNLESKVPRGRGCVLLVRGTRFPYTTRVLVPQTFILFFKQPTSFPLLGLWLAVPLPETLTLLISLHISAQMAL